MLFHGQGAGDGLEFEATGDGYGGWNPAKDYTKAEHWQVGDTILLLDYPIVSRLAELTAVPDPRHSLPEGAAALAWALPPSELQWGRCGVVQIPLPCQQSKSYILPLIYIFYIHSWH